MPRGGEGEKGSRGAMETEVEGGGGEDDEIREDDVGDGVSIILKILMKEAKGKERPLPLLLLLQ